MAKETEPAPVRKGPLEYVVGEATIWRDNSMHGGFSNGARWTVYSQRDKQIIFETDYAAYVSLEEKEEFMRRYDIMKARLRKQSEQKGEVKPNEVDLEGVSKDDVIRLIPTGENYGKIGGAMIGLFVNGKIIRPIQAEPVTDFNRSSVSYIQKLMKPGNGSKKPQFGDSTKMDKPLEVLGLAPEEDLDRRDAKRQRSDARANK